MVLAPPQPGDDGTPFVNWHLQGLLLPAYHQLYYIGLRVTVRPTFAWMDPSVTLSSGGYLNWGTLMPGNISEPNNRVPPEDCGVANYTQSLSGVWGWADINCGRQLISICKILRT